MQEHNRATEWFNELYEKNKHEHHKIPWATKAVNPLLQSYLEDASVTHKGKALVVGCGLGDDAHALYEAGYDVVAIDVSEVALEIAKERSEGLDIKYEKQDIFDMPEKYDEYFDFVFEALTIQSLPREFRQKMVKALTKTVAKEGKILVVAHKKQRDFDGPPWPLTQEEFDLFKENGLCELSFEEHTHESNVSSTRFRVLYEKNLSL